MSETHGEAPVCDEIAEPDQDWAWPPEGESRLIDLKRNRDGLRTSCDAVPATRDRMSGATTVVERAYPVEGPSDGRCSAHSGRYRTHDQGHLTD